jgi:hypothetical protein
MKCKLTSNTPEMKATPINHPKAIHGDLVLRFIVSPHCGPERYHPRKARARRKRSAPTQAILSACPRSPLPEAMPATRHRPGWSPAIRRCVPSRPSGARPGRPRATSLALQHQWMCARSLRPRRLFSDIDRPCRPYQRNRTKRGGAGFSSAAQEKTPASRTGGKSAFS